MSEEKISMTRNNSMLLFCGDIHGEFKKLIWTLTNKVAGPEISEISVVVAGDFGVGFGRPKAIEVLYNSVKQKLEKYNITVYVVRGNHDNPEYFDGNHNFERLIFLEDHKPIEILGKIIYPIGGAHSVDKDWRIEANKEAIEYGSSKRWWWEGEKITEKYKNLPDKVDIIVSHEAPLSFEPVIVRETEDEEMWENIISSRKYLDHILLEVRAKWWIHGHYHKTTSGSYKDIKYRGLNIDELFEIPTE